MRRILVSLALLGTATLLANADPHNLEGGALIAHYIPDFNYRYGWGCEGYFYNDPITDCGDQNNSIQTAGFLDATWFVIASFDEEKEWCGVQFGLGDYDPLAFYFSLWEPCYPPDGGLEISSVNWPGPNAGTAFVVTGVPWSGNFVPLYAFYGYAYGYGAPTIMQLIPDPSVPSPFGGMGNCATPPEKWDAALGGMGINMDGTWVCGEPPVDLFVCCVGEDCYLVETEDECTQMGGEFNPDLQSCEPNPCAAWGACCYDCDCVLEWQVDCEAQGGIFVGGECVPNPCGTPSGTTSWGAIKSLYR